MTAPPFLVLVSSFLKSPNIQEFSSNTGEAKLPSNINRSYLKSESGCG